MPGTTVRPPLISTLARIAPLGAVLAAGTMLVACAADRTSDGNATGSGESTIAYADLPERLLGDWRLEALRATPLSAMPSQGLRETPTLRLDPDGRVGGFAGINRWFSTIDLDALTSGRFAIGPAGSTMMAGHEDAMAIERGFLSALQDAARIDATMLPGGVLRLLDADGNEALRFIRSNSTER